MSAISLKSITGITSITTPAGVDNQLTLHNNNTTEAVKLDIAGNLHINNQLAVSGVTTFASGNVQLASDSQRLQLGSGQDLWMYHTGTSGGGHGLIQNEYGTMYMLSANWEYRHYGTNQTTLKINGNQSVELYHNNTKMAYTSSSGFDVTNGDLRSHLNIKVLNDNQKLLLGAGNDLQLYHDGSHSYIDNNTGSLRFRDAGGAEKFRISGSGTQFNDDITLSNDNDKINIGASSDLQIYHDGTNSILYNNTGQLALRGNEIRLTAKNTENYFVGTLDGAVNLYHNNNLKLQTTSSGITVTGGITANANSAYSASIVFSDATGIRLSHTNQTDGNDGVIAAAPFGSGLNIVGTQTTAGTGRQVRMWGDVFPSTNGAEKLGLSGNRWSKLYVNQILFGGDTATQNELDDYEEGTWTPSFDTSVSSGSITVGGYATQSGFYRKIGSLVYVEGALKTTSVTKNSNGTYDIAGLPFTSASGGGAGTSGEIHAGAQANWSVAPDKFTVIVSNTRARARGGLNDGAGSYTNGNTSGFNTSSGQYNRVYFHGVYIAE